MTTVAAVGTYLPPWGSARGRVLGPDEDAVTLAVAAARAALEQATTAGSATAPDVRRVVFVTRELPLLVGGNAAALLAGIGLPDDVPVVEQVGGGPAVFDTLGGAEAGTLVIGVDAAESGPVGAAAALVAAGDGAGVGVELVGRVVRSLPVLSRANGGGARDYSDARLERERGVGVAIERLDLTDKPVVVAGLPAKQARALCAGVPPTLPTTGASAALFAVAALAEVGGGGLVLAVEQGSATALRVDGVPAVRRDEPALLAPEKLTRTPGPDIAISLAAYERAFDAKLRWDAGACDACGTLALPPRRRCLNCGSEDGWSLTPLPRTGEVYTVVTVHVPVPGLPTPYSLAIVQLDGVDVRALVKVTGAPAGTVQIGDRGRLVLRRVAVRSGIPDYGYALYPDAATAADAGEGAVR
ncbi:Zn-ribbon domain-containing OB-fold protein [Frankia sp. ACN1ag]|uniref:Zn-ribbon domain-containing OB-fold protein n=1 Tax=Frankia sp. ACN1ag TaxID=102891 RepID=UPI0006DC5BC7|nr:OB-fold domain-containing protein [Frankia sp. ACN1ag]KQC37112.1 DNA-binding protein [Frankia sp. ACN1ag]